MDKIKIAAAVREQHQLRVGQKIVAMVAGEFRVVTIDEIDEVDYYDLNVRLKDERWWISSSKDTDARNHFFRKDCKSCDTQGLHLKCNDCKAFE
jgi:hypothetical protein